MISASIVPELLADISLMLPLHQIILQDDRKKGWVVEKMRYRVEVESLVTEQTGSSQEEGLVSPVMLKRLMLMTVTVT